MSKGASSGKRKAAKIKNHIKRLERKIKRFERYRVEGRKGTPAEPDMWPKTIRHETRDEEGKVTYSSKHKRIWKSVRAPHWNTGKMEKELARAKEMQK